MTKRYLVVSAIRIQSWLVRAPRLRLIRGGSLALADRTRHGAIDGILDAAGFESRTSSEGGDIDGVVVIDVDGSRASPSTRWIFRRTRSHRRGL